MTDRGPSGSSLVGAETPRRAWRGGRGPVAVLRHRWQKDWTSEPQHRQRAGDHWRRIRIGGMLALFAGLVALLVVNVLFAPVQTPLLAITAPTYSWPLPPNAWAQEDLEGLGTLDGETVRLVDLTSSWASKQRGLRNLDRQLRQLAEAGAPSGTVIIYISMHGVVDGSRTPAVPCLIPPDASPLKPETWLPLAEVFSRLKAQRLPDEWHKLVVLDCGRLPVDWNLGVLYNTFADHLGDVVSAADIPNLVLMNSTRSGQTGWASPNLRGSVFGHFFRQGLAGAADSETGNSDHRVSLHELTDYLQKHVDGWAAANRADSQQPLVIPQDGADFHVAWTLSGRWQSRVDKQLANAPTPTSTTQSLPPLWRKHDQLLASSPYCFDPLGWRDFEQQLLWLEQATVAGKAYGPAIEQLLLQLQTTTTRLTEQFGKPNADGNPSSGSTMLSAIVESAGTLPPGHSLPWVSTLGQLSPAEITAVSQALERFEQTPSETTLSAALAHLSEKQAALVEPNFLRILQRYVPQQLWQRPQLLTQAIDTLERAERLAVPADPRIQYWAKVNVAPGDAARRAATDLLFMADDDSLARSTELWKDANKHYDQAQLVTDKVSDSLRLRDRAWLDAGYLAQWLTRPMPSVLSLKQESSTSDKPETKTPLSGNDQQVNELLLPLFDQITTLGETLDATAAIQEAGGTRSLPFEDTAADVETKLKKLRELYDKQCAKLIQAREPDALTVREIESVLALPLISARQREELRQMSTLFSAKLQTGRSPAESESTANASASSSGENNGHHAKIADGVEYLRRMTSLWQQHPAIVLASGMGLGAKPDDADDGESVSRPTGDADASTNIDQQGAQIRRLLAGLPQATRDPLQHVNDEESDRATSSARAVAQARRSLSRSARMARHASSLWCPRPDIDPVQRLRRFDLAQMFAWSASRSLEDFWGPIAGNQEQPLFAICAADYLRAARQAAPSTLATDREFDNISNHAESLQRSARLGLRTLAPDLLIQDTDSAPVILSVRNGDAEAVKSLQPGIATVLLRDDQGLVANAASQLVVPLPPEAPPAEIRFELPGSALAERGPTMQAVTMLRGNEFSASFLVRDSGGVKVDFRPFNYGPPRVTVSGRNKRKASIVFILDCSQSMSALTEGESPDGGKLTRLDVAKTALLSMLNRLAAQGDSRVGVRFYGHRVGWNTKQTDQLLRQTDYARPIPDNLTPSEDVESVLPLGRFDTVIAGGVEQTMRTLKPWGETPLYLAIIQALGEFNNDNSESEKSVVVITDGVNYQYNSPDPKRLQDVLTAAGQKKVAVQIVGFNIAAGEQATASREFGTLAEQTKGRYVPATSANSLIKSLETLLGASQYAVFDSRGKEVNHAKVGAQTVLKRPAHGVASYTVALDNAATEIEVGGGEALELVVGRNGRDIRSVGYDIGDPQFGSLINDNGGALTGMVVGVHRPLEYDGGLRFPFSIQHKDHQFTPRPAETWIEIAPRVQPGQPAAAKYVFYDTNYEPDTPVPVLNWIADRWPAGIKQADVKVWTKIDHTPPNGVLSLGKVDDSASATSQPVPGVEGVSYQVRVSAARGANDSVRVSVVERHSPASPGLDAVKVEIYPRAEHIVHRFDEASRLVIHTFYYENVERPDLGSHELRFTSRKDAQEGASHLREPLVIDVTAGKDVLQLAPGDNGK